MADAQSRQTRDDPQAPGKDPSAAFALASISFIGPLAIHAYLPVMPGVRDAFQLSEAQSQLNFSAPLFVMAFATLIYGSMADRYGRRPVLLTGLTLFIAGSALCVAAPNAPLLLAGRIVQAAGAGCGIALVRTIARDAYGAERLVKAIAYLTMAYTLGPALAPVAGGFLYDAFGWRASFIAILVCAVLIWIASWRLISETRPRNYAATQSFRGLLRGYGELFSRWRFCVFVCQSGFSSAVFFTMAAASTGLMKDQLQRPASEFGLYFMAFPIGFFMGNWISTRLSGKVRLEAMVLAGSVLATAANFGQCAFLLGGVLNPAVLFLPGFFVTLAQGLSLPYAQAGAIATIPRLTGTASGIGVFLQSFLGAIATQVYGVFSNGTVYPLIWVSTFCAVAVLASGVAAWLGRPRPG